MVGSIAFAKSEAVSAGVGQARCTGIISRTASILWVPDPCPADMRA
jgi:hypothetical protein